MSRQRFQAKAKTVQKLRRDGLVEVDRATGEEKRVSQRTADISFGPERPARQADLQDGARTHQRRQIREQATQSAREEEPEYSTALDIPTPEQPAAPRGADDVPLNATAIPEKREQYKKALVRQQFDQPPPLIHEQDGSENLQFEPEQNTTAASDTPEEIENAAPRDMEEIRSHALPEKSGKRTEKRRIGDGGHFSSSELSLS